MEALRVSAKTQSGKLAGSIAGVMREAGEVKIQAVGAGALNQAVKGIAIARGFLAPQGIDIYVIPGFTNVEMSEGERTSIVLEVRKL